MLYERFSIHQRLSGQGSPSALPESRSDPAQGMQRSLLCLSALHFIRFWSWQCDTKLLH